MSVDGHLILVHKLLIVAVYTEIVGKLIQIFKLHQQWNLLSRVDLFVDA